MLGLRTQETNRFTSFFELVQQKATEKESVFFLIQGMEMNLKRYGKSVRKMIDLLIFSAGLNGLIIMET